MTITYQVKNNIYVNLTNRCPCACTFCLRKNAPSVHGAPSLWLEREPTLEEITTSLDRWDWTKYAECVFCGYGEPTERLEDLLAAARHMRAAHPGVKIRVNTNGLSDLIAGKPTAPLFAGLADTLSVSLNTDDEAEYLRLCRPRYGAEAYPAMLRFTSEAAKVVPHVVMTVVGEPVTPLDKQERCRKIAEGLGATLRVRPYEA